MTLSQIVRQVGRPFKTTACTCREKHPRICAVAKWCSAPIWVPVRWMWWLRHYEIGAAFVLVGLYLVASVALPNLYMKSPQEVWYDKASLELRKDLDRKAHETDYQWTAFVSPEMGLFEKSIRYYQDQQEASLWDRLRYGRPNTELAAEAWLKMGVIKLMSANGDQQNVAMAKEYLEKAVALNPGIPYAKDLIADPSRVNELAVQALAGQRDLEMLLQNNPQQRSKPKPKDGQKNGQGNQQGKKNQGQQQGQGNKPEKKPGDGKNQDKPAPSSMNKSLQQNMQDVQNGTGNDGI
jgi:hypothetical protein